MLNQEATTIQATAKSGGEAKRFNSYILLFSIAFTLFVMGPPFLGYTFSPYPLIKVSDVFDLFTPLVLIPLYWLLFSLDNNNPGNVKENLAFVVFSAFWVFGKGMQLAANSIGHLTNNITAPDLYNLIYFYDEVLGHYFWHFGVMALSALLIYRQWKNPFAEGRAITWNNIIAGIIYGFTFFAMTVEGQTTPMGVPFAVLSVTFGLVWGRKKLSQQPLLFLFLVAYLVAVILFAIWGIWQHGLPEFSEVGIIK